MARGFRRRYVRRYRRRYSSKRARLIRKRMMIRRRIKKFVNRMGYPSYVKMIGMTESKKLLLRKTLMLDSKYSGDGAGKTNAFQIILNPLECPNINKVFTNAPFVQQGKTPTENKDVNFDLFRYDYLRIKNIFISIKPAQNVSTSSGNAAGNNLYDNSDDSPISNVYAYFSYKNPILSPFDISDTIQEMYGTNPKIDRIKLEGKLKNVYSWPSNKAMTISVNKLMYRVNTEPYKICTNTPLDIQFLNSLIKNDKKVYDPFEFGKEEEDDEEPKQANEMESDDDENFNYGTTYTTPDKKKLEIDLPDLYTNTYSLFFGRLVIVSPKQMRFTAEICYDCVLLR